MTEKRNIVYLSKSNENYYEMAWGARAAEKRHRLGVRWLAPDVMNPREGNPTSIVLWDNRV